MHNIITIIIKSKLKFYWMVSRIPKRTS